MHVLGKKAFSKIVDKMYKNPLMSGIVTDFIREPL